MKNVQKNITIVSMCLVVFLMVLPVSAVGPDDYGYMTLETDPNSLRNISTTGIYMPLGDDSTVVDIPIGFDFEFYGNTYSVISVRSNGYMGFEPGFGDSHHAQSIPSLDIPNNCIYGCIHRLVNRR